MLFKVDGVSPSSPSYASLTLLMLVLVILFMVVWSASIAITVVKACRVDLRGRNEGIEARRSAADLQPRQCSSKTVDGRVGRRFGLGPAKVKKGSVEGP